MLLQSFVAIVLLCSKLVHTNAKMQDLLLLDDIMNEKLMPVSLMMIGGQGTDKIDTANFTKSLDDEFRCATKMNVKEDGTLNNAFNSMGFHRKMINEYMCSKFIAGQILDEVQPRRMKSRLGVAAAPSNISLPFDAMLFDQGSFEYKNWLAK